MAKKQEAIKVVTASGFPLRISSEVMDDWDLLEVLRKLDQGEAHLVIDAFKILLGDDQYENIKEHLRKDGKLKASDMMNEFADIMTKAKELKN